MQDASNNNHNDKRRGHHRDHHRGHGHADAGPDAPSSLVLSRRQLHGLLAAMAGIVCLPSVQADEAANPAPADRVERLPLGAFAQLPRMQNVQLSPDGRHIACLINLDDTTVLVTRAVAGDGALTALLKTDNQRFHFLWLAWVGNERVVASVRYASDRFQVDATETRLLSVARDGTSPVMLSQQRETSRGRMNVQLQDRVIDWMPRDGQHILLAAPEGNRGYAAVYKLDVSTGKRSMVQVPRQGVGSWITDAQHRVRVGVMQSGLSIEVVERPVDGAFRTLWSFERYTPAESWPLGFGANPQELWGQACTRATRRSSPSTWPIRPCRARCAWQGLAWTWTGR